MVTMYLRQYIHICIWRLYDNMIVGIYTYDMIIYEWMYDILKQTWNIYIYTLYKITRMIIIYTIHNFYTIKYIIVPT